MRIKINNELCIYEPSAAVLDYCRNHLVLDNPDYYKKERLGKWTGNTPKDIQLYVRDGDLLYIPYGCKNKILAISDECPKEWGLYPDIKDYMVDYHSAISLYDYQAEAVEMMRRAINGVCVMPCGSGKTQTALALIAKLGLRTLWLTHTQDLLRQSLERAKSCFGCDTDMYGTITEGKVNIGKGITFATVQTMCKTDLDRYVNTWAVVVVDECQHCCGSPTRVSQFYKVVNNLYAPYKFGLTATPYRNDGLDASMYALLGDIVIEISNDVVAERTCAVKVQAIDTGYMPNYDAVLNGDGTINYSDLISDLISDNKRLRVIMDVVNRECKRYSIVLANRIKYLKDMQQAYSGKSICISSNSTSKKAKAERKEALRRLNSGDIDCIFATYQLAAEGLDCPNLRYVVFATPEKDKRTVIQSVGRVARKADGKEYGTVIDFVDAFSLYQGWYKKRKGYYKALKCEICDAMNSKYNWAEIIPKE